MKKTHCTYMYIALRGRSQYVTEYEYLIYIYKYHNHIGRTFGSNIIKSVTLILLSKVGNFICRGFGGTPNISAKK